jgi:hypothetical protein
MRADTQAISIEAQPSRVLDLVADPMNLPRWAVGFARSVRPDGDRWIVSTGSGEIGLRLRVERAAGTVDFHLEPAPGVEALAASRVIPRGAKSEFVFTQFQSPGLPDEAFQASVEALGHELKVLKALAEVECPL